jgi:ribosome maturation protein SDO1
LLPIKVEKMRVAVKVFPEHAAKAYGSIKGFGTITKEEWQSDGSLVALVEMPAGLYSSFVDRIGKITQGTVQTKVLK